MPAVEQFTPDVYVWSFPGCPLRVHFLIPLIERLAAELNRTADSAETGGLLIGKFEGAITQIVDFQPVPCDSPGSEYVPSTPTTLSRFEETIGQTGSMAVGYYRIQNRGINQLSDNDLALIDHYFTGPGNVHLVMGPTNEGPNMTGVFFRENGLVYPVSFMEFACDPHTLRLRRPPAEPRLDFDLEEAPEDAHVSQPLPAPPDPAKHRVPRWGLFVMVGLIALAAIAASVAGFRWGRSGLAVSEAPPQLAPGRGTATVDEATIAESAKLRETVRQIQQNLDTRLAENESMKVRIKELDDKLAQFTGTKKAPVAPAVPKTPTPVATAVASPQPATLSQGTAVFPQTAPLSGDRGATGDPIALNPLPAPAEIVRSPVTGPTSGKLLWTGYLAAGATMAIEGRRASAGNVNGTLPSAPLRVSVYPAELSSGGLSAYSSQPRHASGNVVERQSAETGWLPMRYLYNVERSRGIVMVEAPAAANGYKLTLRGGDKPVSVVVIEWRIAQ